MSEGGMKRGVGLCLSGQLIAVMVQQLRSQRQQHMSTVSMYNGVSAMTLLWSSFDSKPGKAGKGKQILRVHLHSWHQRHPLRNRKAQPNFLSGICAQPPHDEKETTLWT